ncbi:MAG: glycerol kinase GlpK [Pseudomonadota bacterium]
MSDALLLAIDQGTTSTRSIIFNRRGEILHTEQREFPQHYPEDGWVEHDPEDIWDTTLSTCRAALAASDQMPGEVAAIGITNQRETTVIWDRETGRPIHNAIVWQDRRTASTCEQLRGEPNAERITDKTGLLIDPYFSATKIAWILDEVEGARELAAQGRLAFGTTDSFLIWRLTGGRVHATDASNASRTLLFDIKKQRWDEELLRTFNVPESVLPEVRDSAGDYGRTCAEVLGRELPITGVAGDQQAAMVGQACFEPGMIKSTYGTGCFVMLNTGEWAVKSQNRLLATVAYRINGKTTYALEGSIFVAGAAVQWLRDGLQLISSASETEVLASALDDNHNVYLVPAFTGLGAPYWNPRARGALFGLTRDTGIGHIVRAALESVCYQTNDLMGAMARDGANLATLRVDGGMVSNNWLLQCLSDVLDMPVERPEVTETTALGAANLAGLGAGLYASLDEIGQQWRCAKAFAPQIDPALRQRLLDGWSEAVIKVNETN